MLQIIVLCKRVAAKHYKKVIFLILLNSSSAVADVLDSVFTENESLSPEKLVALVIQRNPDIQAAISAWRAAHQRIVQVGALDDPMIKYSVAPRTLRDSDVGARHSVALSQHLPWSGKRKLKQDRARYQASVNKENLNATQIKLSELAKLAYADWYFAHAALRINRHNHLLVDEFKQIADIKYSAGKVSKQDVLQAEMEILLLQQRTITLRRKRRVIQASLNALLNRPANAYVPTPQSLSTKFFFNDQQNLVELALQQRPELRALQHRIAEANISVLLADKARYPDFTVNALYNGVMDPADKRLQIGVAINIPFGDKLEAKQRESRAYLQQLGWERQSIVISIKAHLQQALDRIQESRQLMKLYQGSLLPLARENMTTAKQDYETGRGDFLSLITAEKNLTSAQLAQEHIQTQFHQGLTQLDRILGNLTTRPVSADRSVISDAGAKENPFTASDIGGEL